MEARFIKAKSMKAIDPTSNPLHPPRRHDLDWIRVLAVIALLFFHTGMLFTAEWDWHLKNAETSNLFLEWMHFMTGCRMSLLFFVSGAGTFFALGFRSPREYLRERGARLIIPLVFGMAVITPPQVYFERLLSGMIEPGYLSFWPASLLSGPYPSGHLTWNHLWFILYLFLYSVLALPVLIALRKGAWAWLDRVAFLRPRSLVFFMAFTYALVYALLTIPFPGPQNLIDDWGRFASYLLLFVYGFVALARQPVGEALFGQRRAALQTGALLAVILYGLRWNQVDWDWGLNPASVGYMLLRGLVGFSFMTAILGYARKFLNRGSAWLSYANEAVYPFYILHQTVIIVIGYYVVQTSDGILSKFLFISVLSFSVSLAIYELFIRCNPLLRPLFGLKSKKSAAAAAANSPTSVPLHGRQSCDMLR